MLDLTKPIQTRDGRKVRLLCTNKIGREPIVGLIVYSDGSEVVGTWDSHGRYFADSESVSDLVNVQEKKKIKVEVRLVREPVTGTIIAVCYSEQEEPAWLAGNLKYISETTIEMEY